MVCRHWTRHRSRCLVDDAWTINCSGNHASHNETATVRKRLSFAFDFVASEFFSPAWRNWQTRWTQNPVIARSCGFEPLRRQSVERLSYVSASCGAASFPGWGFARTLSATSFNLSTACSENISYHGSECGKAEWACLLETPLAIRTEGSESLGIFT